MKTDTLNLPRALAPVNELLTPGIRRGIANPLPLTTGFVILEVIGRRSGELRSTPLLCTDYGRFLLVSTVRSDSQWVRNLSAAGEGSVWLRGRRRRVTAEVYRQGERLGAEASENFWSATAASFSRITGTSIAVLSLTD